MRSILYLVVVYFIYYSALADIEQSSDYRIVVTGCYHGSEIEPIDDKDWYGFFKTDSGYVIESVNVLTNACYDVVLDHPGDTTGVSVSIEHALNPIIIIQCSKKLTTGLVPTTFSKKSSLEPGKPVFLGGLQRADSYTLAALGEVTDEDFREPGDLLILNYSLKLFGRVDEPKKQIIVEYNRLSYDGMPSVIWSGDLDRDNKLDLLLDVRNHYNITHYALYLSSEADDNKLLKLVAELILRGC